ncbi:MULTISPECIES: tRNA (guanosine(37)-N1)-methyltransferase TrmD [Thiorhodovibrio]|uniref:tRNA (guanosine(37)-N1)-methyltransferase TrmD n=1 Tax=Thiorhodovibrio TaxID=61593 RepID=UPI001911EF70|nr:tRNA (guanosine(37)-N1)-methyltransferase TrmD [Thiorhodovibrio litoralis]MBK5970274.1 tRNA (guanosine(37)-N1)-methyltransferase TrmD [Thiorhodovibrio winogradskyi]WPL14840.1 tRNA (guanine-N(1)-)-methyltransferase [Thiorhodovibrio litoralis]
MRFDVITLFPEQFRILSGEGVVARALSRGIADLHLWNPRDFALGPHRRVDDRPYGGGPGMVMLYEPLAATIAAARAASPDARVAYLSPQGRTLDQQAMQDIAAAPGWILLAGRYEGVDERLLERCVDQEWSIGDYVLSGGELPAMVVMDAVIRLLPGALGHERSALEDSYMNGLLDCPHFSRPEDIAGVRVPDVLLSGDHGAIARWRRKQALGRTWLKRPDLLANMTLDSEEQQLLHDFIQARQGAAQDSGEIEQ